MPGVGRVVERDGDVVIGVYDNVLVSIWRGPSRHELIERIREVSVDLVSKHPEGIASLTVLGQSRPNRLSEMNRAAAARANRAVASKKLADAYVVEVGGMIGATIRAVASGIHLLNRNTYPTKFFDRIPPAIAWLPTVVPSIDAAGLDRFIKTF